MDVDQNWPQKDRYIELQVLVAGAQSSCQYCRSTVWLVLVNSRSDGCRFFVNLLLYYYDLILPINTEKNANLAS